MESFSTWLIEWSFKERDDWYHVEEWTTKKHAQARLKRYWNETTLSDVMKFRMTEVKNIRPVMWTGDQQVIGR